MPNSTQEIVTRADLQYNNAKLLANIKEWFKNNNVPIDIQSEVLRLLDEINNEVVGNNGAEKAQYALETRRQLFAILEEAGFDMSLISFRESIDFLKKEITGKGAFILDIYGERWTASSWAYQKAFLGKDPSTPVGVLLVTTTMTRLIGLQFTNATWGTYNFTVPNLGTNTGLISTEDIKTNIGNTREIVKYANPMLIWQWEEDNNIAHDDVVKFATLEEAQVYAEDRFTNDPTQVNKKVCFIIGEDTLSTYYWSTTTNLLTQRLATIPIVDGKQITGAPAAEICYRYGKTFHTEASDYKWHLPDGFEFMQMAINREAINECLNALGLSLLPISSAQIWTCLQNATTVAYYGSGTSLVSGNGKTSNYAVVPFAVISI